MLTPDQVESTAPNHPLATRMAAIAFINQNIAIACIYGTFSVLLRPAAERLGVGIDAAVYAPPLANLATAICAPLVGLLVTRGSLRTVMLGGSVLLFAGFLVLALTASYPIYLLTYALLLGPGMAVSVITPATLITRWFSSGRARTLGIVTMPLIIALLPLASTWTLQHYGVVGTYIALAALALLPVIANLFVIDQPPVVAGATASDTKFPAIDLAKLASPTFLAYAFAFIATTAGAIIITTQMEPIANLWGYSRTLSATLLTVQTCAGIAGTLVFGWLAGRLGGGRTLALVAIDAGVIWLLLLLPMSFVPHAVLIGLFGLHGAGVLPTIAVALSERFGKDRFAGLYGLVNLVNLPFGFICVPAAAAVFTHTGSYAGAIAGEAAFLLLAGLAVLLTRPGRPQPIMAAA